MTYTIVRQTAYLHVLHVHLQLLKCEQIVSAHEALRRIGCVNILLNCEERAHNCEPSLHKKNAQILTNTNR